MKHFDARLFLKCVLLINRVLVWKSSYAGAVPGIINLAVCVVLGTILNAFSFIL